jgi:uncharacterized protein (TIGR03085 family)
VHEKLCDPLFRPAPRQRGGWFPEFKSERCVQLRPRAAGYRDDVTAAARERAALVRTLRDVGPKAPTLCADWATTDLVAHLILRERRPDAALGIMFAPLGGYTARMQRRITASTKWSDLLGMLAAGPPLYSPFKLLDPLVNTAELYIHHEDVRRAAAGWTPRELDAGLAAALRRMVPLMSWMSLAGAPGRVTLRDPDGATLAAFGHGPQVVIAGTPPELLLYLSGRDATRIEFVGDPDSIAAVGTSRRGL